MDRTLSAWNAHEATARVAKRCPVCNKMIDAADECIARDERRQATSGRTPWIGNRQSYTRGAWSLYHPACWTEFLDGLEAAECRTIAERDARDTYNAARAAHRAGRITDAELAQAETVYVSAGGAQ